MTYPETIDTPFGPLTLTRILGGAPGWYMHAMRVYREDEASKAALRALGYEYWCGTMLASGPIDFYHRRFPLEMV